MTVLLSELQTEYKVVGVKQSRKALRRGNAVRIYLAEDADPQITDPIRELCSTLKVPVTDVSHMRTLGEACGIRLGCAAAALLHE